MAEIEVLSLHVQAGHSPMLQGLQSLSRAGLVSWAGALAPVGHGPQGEKFWVAATISVMYLYPDS